MVLNSEWNVQLTISVGTQVKEQQETGLLSTHPATAATDFTL